MMHFDITEATTLRQVLTVRDITMAVMTTTYIVTPAEVSQHDIDAFITQAAVQDSDGDWRIAIESLGIDTYASTLEDLLSEVAYQLNEYGVSVADWPAYRLPETRET